MSFRPLGTSYPNHTICLYQYETLTHSTFIRQTPGSPRARRRAGGGDSGVSRTGGPALSELVVQWGDRQSGTQRQTDDPAQQCRGGAESSAGGTARVTWAAGRAPPLGAVGTDHPSHGMEGVSPGRWGGAGRFCCSICMSGGGDRASSSAGVEGGASGVIRGCPHGPSAGAVPARHGDTEGPAVPSGESGG